MYPSCCWREWKDWFFILTTFLARGIFVIHDIWKKIEKWPQPKIFLYPKISSVMPVNHAKEFLIYVLYFHTFLSELQIAPITPILGINVPNLLQVLLRACYLLIWVMELDFQVCANVYQILIHLWFNEFFWKRIISSL